MTINKYKTKLLAKRFSSTTRLSRYKSVTIKIIITLAITNKWDLSHLDVNNTFLNDLLDESLSNRGLVPLYFKQIK